MYELDEAIQILCRHLCHCQYVLMLSCFWNQTYRLILLIKIIYISVQNLHKQLYRHRGIHTGIRHTERTLQTLEHALAVSIELTKR